MSRTVGVRISTIDGDRVVDGYVMGAWAATKMTIAGFISLGGEPYSNPWVWALTFTIAEGPLSHPICVVAAVPRRS